MFGFLSGAKGFFLSGNMDMCLPKRELKTQETKKKSLKLLHEKTGIFHGFCKNNIHAIKIDKIFNPVNI